jgi:hypothetical protein
MCSGLAIPRLKPGEKPALSTAIEMAWLAAGFQSVRGMDGSGFPDE